MRIRWWALPLLVLAVFGGSVIALREAGVWRSRERVLPPAEVLPSTQDAAPGAMPM